MAKITRETQKVFGSAAPAAGQFIAFGSLAAGTPQYTKDLSAIQSLAAWTLGWSAATVGIKSPSLEDMNALFLTAFQQLAYIMQAGIPEWDAGTVYYTGSKCMVAGEVYTSLTDDNLNQAVSNTNAWESDTVRAFKRQYPVGEVYLTHRDGNPATLLGFGTWTRIAAGKVPVMLDPADADYNTIGKTGGSKTATIGMENLPNFGNARADGNVPGGSLMTFPTTNGTPINVRDPFEVVFNAWLRTA